MTTIPTFTIPTFPAPAAAQPAPPVVVCPPEQDPFVQLAHRELEGVLATANHRFYGLNMSQHPQAVVKLNQLLNATAPARIIEIGTGNAGLYCQLVERCTLLTYDKTPARHTDLLNRLAPTAFRHADALEDPAVIEEIRTLVALPGRTLLVADAGKALEFNLYVPHLKVGDLVMMHDFSPTAETFKRDMEGKIWNWHEAWYARVAETCCNHSIVHTSYLNDVAWSLGWKAR